VFENVFRPPLNTNRKKLGSERHRFSHFLLQLLRDLHVFVVFADAGRGDRN
jgi:hypothetical protein